MAKATKRDFTKSKFVPYTTKRGADYQVPEELKELNVSGIIRAMADANMSKAAIAKTTGIRYQHVRNVLTEPVRSKKAA